MAAHRLRSTTSLLAQIHENGMAILGVITAIPMKFPIECAQVYKPVEGGRRPAMLTTIRYFQLAEMDQFDTEETRGFHYTFDELWTMASRLNFNITVLTQAGVKITAENYANIRREQSVVACYTVANPQSTPFA